MRSILESIQNKLSKHGIHARQIHIDNVSSLIIDKSKLKAAKNIVEYIDGINSYCYNLGNDDIALMFSQFGITDDDKIALSQSYRKDDLSKALDSTLLCEFQFKSPTTINDRRNAATGQYPNKINPPNKPKKRKSLHDKIAEALDGMATPNDHQYGDIITALKSALTDSGLDAELKAAGVETHIAKPGGHKVTFIKNDVAILQVNTLDLAEPKAMGELLASLKSIASGKAPQAFSLEIKRLKDAAAAAREKESQLHDVAAQHTTMFQAEPETQA